MTEGNNSALITRITLLANRHAAAADHLQKRKVCVAGEFHAYTADVLRDAAKQLAREGV